MSIVRVLVVDDFASFRDAICSMLSNYPDLLVVAEASDGLEAVRKAEELRPDLIVLDLGMPKLNGLEATRRIRILSPKSRDWPTRSGNGLFGVGTRPLLVTVVVADTADCSARSRRHSTGLRVGCA